MRPTLTNAMSPESAHAVYDLLVTHAQASEDGREQFVHHQTTHFVTGYRFGGNLGMGGKFWRNTGRRLDGTLGEIWYVSAYSEDMTPQRRATIDTLAPLLDGLRAEHEQTYKPGL